MGKSHPILKYTHACVLARVPVVYWGGPGGGKTSLAKLYARARGMHLERWIASRCEPIDIKPRIMFDGRVIVGDAPEVGRCKAAIAEGRKALLFCDELNRADKPVEGSLLDVFDSAAELVDPATGAYIAILVACNPPSRGQAARHLESATANRFAHFDAVADHEAFAAAQINGWPEDAADYPEPDPAALAAHDGRSRTLWSTFVRRNNAAITAQDGDKTVVQRPELINGEPKEPAAASRAWPSPRSLENARKVYAVACALNHRAPGDKAPPMYSDDDLRVLVAACVGEAVAVEFMAFVIDQDLPDPEALLADPKSWTPDPARIDRTATALTAIVAAVRGNFTNDRWKAAWKIVNLTEDANQFDAAMLAAGLLVELYYATAKAKKGEPKFMQQFVEPHKLMSDRMGRALV